MKLNVKKTMNYTKLATQSAAISAIRAHNYIVGSVDAAGNVSFGTNPALHYSPGSARGECNRLAKQNPGKLFVFVSLQGGEMVPATSTVSI